MKKNLLTDQDKQYEELDFPSEGGCCPGSQPSEMVKLVKVFKESRLPANVCGVIGAKWE